MIRCTSSLCPRCLKHTPLLRSRSKLSHHPGHIGGNYCCNLANAQYCTIESTSFLHKIMMTCTTPVPSRPKTCCRKEWPLVGSGTLRLDSIDCIATFCWTILTGDNHNSCSAHLRTWYATWKPKLIIRSRQCKMSALLRYPLLSFFNFKIHEAIRDRSVCIQYV